MLKYLAVLFTVGLAYALMEEIFNAGTVSLHVLLQSVMNVIRGDLWDHMWFVYDIIGVYLVLPVLHRFMHEEPRNALILTGLLFAFTILVPTFEDAFPVGLQLPLGGHLFYVCMGGLIAQLLLRPVHVRCICLAGILSALWIVLSGAGPEIGYRHLAVAAMAVSIFLPVSRMRIPSHRWMTGLARCSWGVYLIHPFFINVAIKVLKIDLLSSHAALKLPALLVMVTLLSLAATWLLHRIPVVKKLF